MPIRSTLAPVLARIGLQFREAPSARRSSLFSEQATERMLTLFNAMPDPDEVLRKAGMTRAQLRPMESDDDISAALDTRREAVLAIPWRLEVDGGGTNEQTDWLWDEFERVAESAMRGAFAAVPYGYSVMEVVYKNSEDGRLTWQEVTEKPFEWFIPKLDGRVLYRSTAAPMGEETDPRKFILTARQPTYRNPYGEALFSRLYWPWYFRVQGWRFWAKWLERFGIPMLLGKTSGDPQLLAERLATAVQNAVAAVGQGDEVAVLEQKSGGAQFEVFERAILTRYQRTILGQTLTSDVSSSGGSFAAAKVHDEVRKDKRDADVRMVTRSMQRLVDILWTENRFPGKPPEFVMQDDTGLEEPRAARDATLVNAGIVRLTKDYLLRVYDYEEEDIEVPEKPQPPDAPPPGTDPEDDPEGKPPEDDPEEAAESAQNRARKPLPMTSATPLPGRPRGTLFGPKSTPAQAQVDSEVDRILGRLSAPVDQAMIREAVMAAESPDDLANRMAILMNGRSVEDFEIVLARAMYAADLMGFMHAQAEAKPSINPETKE